MKVYIWTDGAAMPNGGPAGAGYVVVGVGGVHLLGSEALGDATNNVAEYKAVRNALRAAADAGATSAHYRNARNPGVAGPGGFTIRWLGGSPRGAVATCKSQTNPRGRRCRTPPATCRSRSTVSSLGPTRAARIHSVSVGASSMPGI